MSAMPHESHTEAEAPEPCPFTWHEHVCVLPKGNHFIHMDPNGYRWL